MLSFINGVVKVSGLNVLLIIFLQLVKHKQVDPDLVRWDHVSENNRRLMWRHSLYVQASGRRGRGRGGRNTDI